MLSVRVRLSRWNPFIGYPQPGLTPNGRQPTPGGTLQAGHILSMGFIVHRPHRTRPGKLRALECCDLPEIPRL